MTHYHASTQQHYSLVYYDLSKIIMSQSFKLASLYYVQQVLWAYLVQALSASGLLEQVDLLLLRVQPPHDVLPCVRHTNRRPTRHLGINELLKRSRTH